MKKLAVASVLAAVGISVFALTLFHLMPARIYEKLLADALKDGTGLALKSASFDTVFPFGFELKGLRLTGQDGAGIARMDRLRADIDPAGLISGAMVDLSGEAGAGAVEGSISAGLFSSSVELDARGVEFSYIEALEGAGVHVDGRFDGRLSASSGSGGCPKGSARLEGVGLEDLDIRYRGIPIPLGRVDEAGFSADLRNCTVILNGLWVEGSELSLRLLGNIKLSRPLAASQVDLELEIVSHGGLAGKGYILSFIEGYRKSANFYSIPVRGTLGALSAAPG